MVDMLSNAMKNEPAICTCYKEDTIMGHIQHERLPKYKMASSDDRFTFVHLYKSSTITRSLGKM